jgi:hypothetical protein
VLLAATGPVAAAHADGTSAPSYTPYAVGINGGEPSIGYDPVADAAVFGAGTANKRMTWDAQDKLTVADAKAPTSVTSLDAITFTDQRTHRTFVSQLDAVCSLMSFSDDAGKTYTPSQGCGEGTLLDHQSVGGGPYHAPLPPGAQTGGYADAVYYCAQNSFSGTCARSDNGGLTFGPGVPAYNTPANPAPAGTIGGNCSAIHGHLRVSADGTVYLPNKGCGGTPTAGNLTNSEFFGGAPALSVSEDNGTTYAVRPVPGAHNQDESDPSVDADKANTVYFGWEDGTNPSETTYGTESAAKIAVSKDHGKTWSTPYDVSSALGIHNVQFPEVIAGDPGRAAFAFLGTPGIGDDQHNGFVGEWHLYIASTQDGGASWTTVDTTPTDPVQRGCISLQGTSNKTATDTNICSQRNLLDFNDITVDKAGRVLVAYSDGCIDACVTTPTSGSKTKADFVMRQTSGPFLVADAPAADVPEAPVAALLPLTALAAVGALVVVRRRRTARSR